MRVKFLGPVATCGVQNEVYKHTSQTFITRSLVGGVAAAIALFFVEEHYEIVYEFETTPNFHCACRQFIHLYISSHWTRDATWWYLCSALRFSMYLLLVFSQCFRFSYCMMFHVECSVNCLSWRENNVFHFNIHIMYIILVIPSHSVLHLCIFSLTSVFSILLNLYETIAPQ